MVPTNPGEVSRGELPVKARTSRLTVGELRRLYAAVVALTSDLSIGPVLQRVADLSRELVGASYSALGVTGGGDDLSQFITSGVAQGDQRRAGDLPGGLGLLGLGLLGVVLREGRAVRVEDVSEYLDTAGFPPNHAPISSFMGVPIVSRGRALGGLYLVDKIGAREFSPRDQELIALFADQAAAAIENARLYTEVERRAEESHHLYEVSRGLNLPVPLEEIFYNITRAASSILQSDKAHLMVLDEENGLLRAGSLLGFKGPEPLELLVSTDEWAIGHLVRGRRPVVVQDAGREPHPPGGVMEREGIRSFVHIPILVEGELSGVFGVDYCQPNAVPDRALDMLKALADQSATAIQGNRLHQQLRRLAVVEERDRIGRDLHDGVLQSIYAVGLALEGLSDEVHRDPQMVRHGIEEAVQDLNQVIRDIRSYIADLRPRELQGRRFGEALESLVRYLEERTGVYVALDVGVDLDRTLRERHIVNLWHIFQEAFSNIEKYAQARKVLVSMTLSNGALALRIVDDGVGFDVERAEAGTGFGLANIKDRSERLGGMLRVQSSPGKGTELSISIPLKG